MKVLLVNDYGTPHGGAEIATALLRDGLRRRGHEAMLLASSARPIAIASEADAECLGTTSRYRILLQTANPSARRALRRWLDAFRPDIVHVGMFLTQLSPLILPLLRNVPSVYHVHWLRPICPTGFKLLPDGTSCRAAAGYICYRSGCLPLHDWVPLMAQLALWWRWRGNFAAVVANSEATRARLRAEGIENVVAIPCGVVGRERRPPLGGAPTALYCGRLVREKGVGVLLRAWKDVVRNAPEARLVIAGDGPERASLERAAPPGVTFLGHLAQPEMERVASQAWVQVVPSIGEEPFGMVAAEAMMRGSTVVASRIGGLPEIVEDDVSGRLVAPGDGGALATALSALLADRALCERMGGAGYEIARRRFGEAAYVESFLALYETLLARESRAGHT